jgi:hypothetical protein
MIVSTETGGLGNRIKSWMSAMRMDADSRVHWAVTDNMPATFEDLFVNGCGMERVPVQARLHKSWRLEVLPEDEPYIPAGFATVGGGAHPLVRALGKTWWRLTGRRNDRYRYMVFPKSHSRRSSRADARHIDLEYERIPEHFRQAYGQCFARIKVRTDILARVDDYAEAQIDASVIGVQVRTWRDDARRQRKYHLPAMQRLSRLMAAAAAHERFFVVSDADDMIESLRDKYGEDRILQFHRNTPRAASWQSIEGLREDFIDMLLLARTQRLYASYLSTFGETAWWLGGARAKVWVF